MISNLHWNRRRNNFVLEQVCQPVESGGVELERQVLSLQVHEGLSRPRDLLLQRHGRVLEGGVTQHVVVVRRGRREAELETPGRRRLEGAFGPAFSAVGKF